MSCIQSEPAPAPLSDQLLTLIKQNDADPDSCTGTCAAPDLKTPAHTRWQLIERLLHRVNVLEAENAELRRHRATNSTADVRARFIRSLEHVAFWRSKYERLKEYIDGAQQL
jgi:hypothetical protein